MFHSTRIKLTVWYLLIIMLISMFFSVAFYQVATREIRRLIHIEQTQPHRGLPFFMRLDTVQQGTLPNITGLEETENRLKIILICINAGILVVAGGGGYFLAGKTLQPIQEMVDEQNRFITDASHELRTPLTALRSEIEVHLRDKQLTLAQSKSLLESNLEEVITLQDLSNKLLALTKYHQNKKNIFSPVMLSEVIEKAMKKVHGLAKEKHITIAKTISEQTVLGDQQSLCELLVIILDNAIKYSPEHTTITIETKRTDHMIHLTVIDQGIGIDKKDLPYIFDRFYRADISRSKTDISGYGLGLAIAKKIVDEHKGKIQVTSEEKKGTIVAIQLPIG